MLLPVEVPGVAFFYVFGESAKDIAQNVFFCAVICAK